MGNRLNKVERIEPVLVQRKSDPSLRGGKKEENLKVTRKLEGGGGQQEMAAPALPRVEIKRRKHLLTNPCLVISWGDPSSNLNNKKRRLHIVIIYLSF